METCVVVV